MLKGEGMIEIICGIPLFILIVGGLLWQFIDDGIIDPLIRHPAYRRQKEIEDQEFQSQIKSLKSEIAEIATREFEKFRICPNCRVRKVEIMRNTKGYVDIFDSEEKEIDYLDDNGSWVGTGHYETFERYSHSIYSFTVQIFCPCCKKIHFQVSQSTQDNRSCQSERMGEQINTGFEVISLDRLIKDLTPSVYPHSSSITLFNDHLREMRKTWNTPRPLMIDVLKQEPINDSEQEIQKQIEILNAEISKMVKRKVESLGTCPKCQASGVEIVRNYAEYSDKYESTEVEETVEVSNGKHAGTGKYKMDSQYLYSEYSFTVGFSCPHCKEFYTKITTSVRDDKNYENERMGKYWRVTNYKRVKIDELINYLTPKISPCRKSLDLLKADFIGIQERWE